MNSRSLACGLFLFVLAPYCLLVGCIDSGGLDPKLLAEKQQAFLLADEPDGEVQQVVELRDTLLGTEVEGDHDHEHAHEEEEHAHSHEEEDHDHDHAHVDEANAHEDHGHEHAEEAHEHEHADADHSHEQEDLADDKESTDHDHEHAHEEEQHAHSHKEEDHDHGHAHDEKEHADHEHEHAEEEVVTEVSLPTESMEVVVMGQIGGLTNPWAETQPDYPFAKKEAKFFLADAGEVVEAEESGHVHAPGEECPFCAAHAKDNVELIAVVHFVDEKGKILPMDVRELFDLKEKDTVVVRGKAQVVPGGLLVVEASGIYVRR